MICTSRKYSDEIPCIVVKTFVGRNMQWGPILFILLFSDIYHWNDKLSESSPIPGSDLLRASLMHVPHQRWRDFSGSASPPFSPFFLLFISSKYFLIAGAATSPLSPQPAPCHAPGTSWIPPNHNPPLLRSSTKVEKCSNFPQNVTFPPSGTSLLLS